MINFRYASQFSRNLYIGTGPHWYNFSCINQNRIKLLKHLCRDLLHCFYLEWPQAITWVFLILVAVLAAWVLAVDDALHPSTTSIVSCHWLFLTLLSQGPAGCHHLSEPTRRHGVCEWILMRKTAMWTGNVPSGILSWDRLLWKRTNPYCHYCSFSFIFLCSSFDSFSLPPLYSHPMSGKQDILWNSFLPVWVYMISLISNSLQWKWTIRKHNYPADEIIIQLFFEQIFKASLSVIYKDHWCYYLKISYTKKKS